MRLKAFINIGLIAMIVNIIIACLNPQMWHEILGWVAALILLWAIKDIK